MAWIHDEEDHPLSERGIVQRNHALLRRYREFRHGTDAVTAAWRVHTESIGAALGIGQIAEDRIRHVSGLVPVETGQPENALTNVVGTLFPPGDEG